MTNPWGAALLGLFQSIVFLAVFYSISEGLNRVAERVFHKTHAEWTVLRVENFWLFNLILAPLMLGYFALTAHLLGFSATRIGFNTNQLGLSLGVALPLSLTLGGLSAFAATVTSRQGITPMKGVPFGRSRRDTIGMIGYMAVLVGPLEEIPFRGIIQTLLMQQIPLMLHIGPVAIRLGTIVSVLIFVLYHYRNVMLGGESNTEFLRLSFGRTVISFILALLFQATGSLLGPIIFHNIVDTCTITAVSLTVLNLRSRGQWPPHARTETIAPAAHGTVR